MRLRAMAFTLDAMSIYGQDTRMLDSWYGREEPQASTLLPHSTKTNPTRNATGRCFFLELPIELRQQIYEHALAKTLTHPNKGIVWLRGSTSLLALNSQIHDEASLILYSHNTFVVEVIYDCSTFDCKWILPNGLVPKKRLAFPEQIGARYVQLLRKIHVNVHHLDQYTGMIKYNYSGSGLTDGLRGQVQFLCHRLAIIPTIRRLDIVFKDDTRKPQVSQQVLKPFLDLTNVQSGSLDGDLEPDFSAILLSQLNPDSGKKTRLSFSDIPAELRQQIYQMLLDFNSSSDRYAISKPKIWVGPQSASHFLSLLALGYTNHAFYSEVQSFIFSTRHFHLKISQNLLYRLDLDGHSTSWKPVTSFPQGVYVAGFLDLRELSVDIEPLTLGSFQMQEIELFLDKLIGFLKTAPLRSIIVRYASGKRKSCEESPTCTMFRQQTAANYAGTFDVTADRMGVRRRTAPNDDNLNPLRSSSPNHSRETRVSSSFTRDPTSTTPNKSASNPIQTSAISYLLSKFNPVVAQVKAKENGQAGFCQYDTYENAREPIF